MEWFGKLLGCLICAVPVIGAIAAVVIAVQLVIAFWPIIVGFGVLLFILYIFFVGLCHLGGDDKKK